MNTAARLALLGVLLFPAGVFAHRLDHGGHQDAQEHPQMPADKDAGNSLLSKHGTAPERVRALIDRYHTTGDDHLLDQGWSLLEPALASEATAPSTLLAAAWLAQAGHDFDKAQSYLRHVLLLRPDHGEAWLLRASVALVQGDVETAREACGRTTLAVPVVVTAACFARAEAHHADVESTRRAYERLAATLSVQAPVNPELLGWLHSVAADLASRGGAGQRADRHYREALAHTPTVSVRTGYADLLLATGRAGEVLTLVGPESTAPSLVLRRVLAQQMLGQGPTDERLAEISSRFRHWIADGDMRHAREMALFYLHVQPDPALAYQLAQRNFSVQREPEDRALLCQAADRLTAAGDGHAHARVALQAECANAARLPLTRAVSSLHDR